MEAFGDAVVAHEAPHAGDRLQPVAQGVCQSLHGLNLILTEGFDPGEQFSDALSALLFGLVLVVHEGAQFVHLLMEGFEDGVVGEEVLKAGVLLFGEFFRGFAEGGEVAPVGLEWC